MYFATATISVIAVFLFLAATPVPQARAYAIGANGQNGISSQPLVGGGNGAAGSSYNVGNSLQGLVSPFTGFINSLKWTNNTSLHINNTPVNVNINTVLGVNNASSGIPTITMTPISQIDVQNMFSQWLGAFDNWFYGVTGIQLDGALTVVLNVFSWAFGLAWQGVNWLLGLVHLNSH
jgi:hypothetical protein